MKALFVMFILTPGEQRLVIFVVAALFIGASVEHRREMSFNGAQRPSSEPSLIPLPSPTPNER